MKIYWGLPASNRWSIILLLLMPFNMLAQDQNMLSQEEKSNGWKLLFDGQSLNGWRGYNKSSTQAWAVEDGIIVNKPGKDIQHSDLVTESKYGDFELLFDWKVENGANSGLIYRIEEGNWASYESGPEYQLIDDKGYKDKLALSQLSGASYDMYSPSADVAKPAGQFNTSRIVAKGNHVEHYLNGVKVAEYDFFSDDWKAKKEKSKWKDTKQYGKASSGHIALQDHGGGISFRNIKIRTL